MGWPCLTSEAFILDYQLRTTNTPAKLKKFSILNGWTIEEVSNWWNEV